MRGARAGSVGRGGLAGVDGIAGDLAAISGSGLLRKTSAGALDVSAVLFTDETNGRVGVNDSAPDVTHVVVVNDAATNSLTNAARISHRTSGTAAAGFGVGVVYGGEDAGGAAQDIAIARYVLTTATAAAEVGVFRLGLVDGGSIPAAGSEQHQFTPKEYLAPAGTAAEGTAGLPSIGAVADTDTGFLWEGGDKIAIVLTGSVLARFAASFAGSVSVGHGLALSNLIVTSIYGGDRNGAQASGLTINGGTGTAPVGVLMKTPAVLTLTSGTQAAVKIDASEFAFSPTSGTAAFRPQWIEYGVNQTGGANGTITGIYTNATETALVGTHNVIDLNVGGVSMLKVDRTGLASFGLAKIANGGGVPPVVGTIGGSGPATAGQSGWVKMNFGGVAYFLPAWV